MVISPSAEQRTFVVCSVKQPNTPASRDPPLNPYFVRLYWRYGRNVAIVAVAQRLARILFQMWRTGQDFDVRKLNVRPVQRVRSRTYYFEIKPPKALKA